MIACSIRFRRLRSVKVTKPMVCCSRPVPQLVDFSVWPIMCGGTP